MYMHVCIYMCVYTLRRASGCELLCMSRALTTNARACGCPAFGPFVRSEWVSRLPFDPSLVCALNGCNGLRQFCDARGLYGRHRHRLPELDQGEEVLAQPSPAQPSPARPGPARPGPAQPAQAPPSPVQPKRPRARQHSGSLHVFCHVCVACRLTGAEVLHCCLTRVRCIARHACVASHATRA